MRQGEFAIVLMAGVAFTTPGLANAVTDWDEIAVKLVQPSGPVQPIPAGTWFRAMAMVHTAMFNAVNCIEPRYQYYKTTMEPARGASQEAAAAVAAATVLGKVVPGAAVQPELTDYLGKIADGAAKERGMAVGRQAALEIVGLRANDGSDVRNGYRPVTTPGKYVPTAVMVGWETLAMKPFAMSSPSQFRPGPPPDLTSATWARDYNEIKEIGEKFSTRRTPRQTEDARFWLTVGPVSLHPFERQIVTGLSMTMVDSARFMAVLSVAEADAIQAVYEAKYHYQFWRPMTAIRNGDIDGNSATDRDPTWEPIDTTPMHPEYPCAHCILSTAVATAIEGMTGTSKIPEVAISMPSAPGVTHRYTNLDDYTEEVAMARIYAGFHYRTSTEVGREIGRYVVETVMQPAKQ